MALQIGKDMDCNLKVVKCEENGGKGLAVKLGMLCSTGEYCLFADADGATQPESYDMMEAELRKKQKRGEGAAIGSRNKAAANVEVKVNYIQRSKFRKFINKTFLSPVRTLFKINVSVASI